MRIGIDLGGTKAEGICLGDDGSIVAHERIATPHTEYGAVVEALAGLAERLTAAAGAPGSTPVGAGTPGFLSPLDGRLRNSNLTILNGHAIDRDLAERLKRPVRVANDANCFVLSEVADGAATVPPIASLARPDVVFGATLGTGIGGGLVIDGRVLNGASGSAGQWSHTTLPFLTPDDGAGAGCVCGHPACIESFLSGKGLAWDHERATGEKLPAPEVAERARAGDARARDTFARYEDRLARALASVINLVDPRAIVLGGGISNNDRIFENVPKLWNRYTVAEAPATQLVRAKHGDASGVRGAAWLWPVTAGGGRAS